MNNTIEINVKENEELTIPVLWVGKETNLSYRISLDGKGASVNLSALILGEKEDNLYLNIFVRHNSPETKSKVIVKSVLYDKAQVNFDGLVKIEKNAKGTNTWLAAHILLLSNRAKGQAIPSLEIAENDIKAGHATTVGRINNLELFYLMSRGLTMKKAKQILIEGFLHGMLKNFPKEMAIKAGRKIKLRT